MTLTFNHKVFDNVHDYEKYETAYNEKEWLVQLEADQLDQAYTQLIQ